MKKCFGWMSGFLLFPCFGNAQSTTGRLHFEPAKTYTITITTEDTLVQQAGNNAIDFFAKGTAVHTYQVMTAAGNNTTLYHRLNRLSFQFDGMNQKRAFDSDTTKQGAFRELLDKQYTITLDASGKVISTEPRKIEPVKPDENFVMLADMLQDIITVAYPPSRNEKSFFKILPDRAVNTGESWSDSVVTENEKAITTYTLTAVSDSELAVDFKTTASSETSSEIMGRASTTKSKTITAGKIILDKVSGILKEKTSYSQSNGNKEMMGASLPISGKTSTVIKVSVQ